VDTFFIPSCCVCQLIPPSKQFSSGSQLDGPAEPARFTEAGSASEADGASNGDSPPASSFPFETAASPEGPNEEAEDNGNI